MFLNSRVYQQRRTRSDRKRRGVLHNYYLLKPNRLVAKQNHLTSEQVRAGTGVVRTYADWEALFKSSEVGGVLGIDCLFGGGEEG